MRKIALWLSFVLIFTIPWESAAIFQGLGTVSRSVGLVVAFIWFAAVFFTNRIRKPHLFHLVFFLFVLWNIISIFWSVDFDLTRARLQTCIQLAVFVYIILDIYDTPHKIHAGLQAYVLGAWVNFGMLIANFIAGNNFRSARYVATGFDPNNNGIVLALGIPLAWYLFTTRGNSKAEHLLSILNLIYIPAAMFGILITASRAALITSIPALLYILVSLTDLKIHVRVFVLLVLVYAVFVLQPLVPQGSLQRVATARDNIAQGDLNGRVNIWRAGLDSFAQRPLLGVGSHAFKSSIDLNKVVHNSYLSVLFELGMIGFSILVILIGITARSAIHLPKPDRRFWLILLVVLAIGIFSLNWKHRKTTWLIPSMIIATASLTTHQSESKQLYKKGAKHLNTISMEAQE